MRSEPGAAALPLERSELTRRITTPPAAETRPEIPFFGSALCSLCDAARRLSATSPIRESAAPTANVAWRGTTRSVSGSCAPASAIQAAVRKSALAGSASALGISERGPARYGATSPARIARSAAPVAAGIRGAIRSVRGIDQRATRPKSAMTTPIVAAWAAMLTATSSAITDHSRCTDRGRRGVSWIATRDQSALFARRPAVASAERRKPASYAIDGSRMSSASAA